MGVYLVDTRDGPALFDCGPSSTVPALEAGLADQGLELTDVRHLLLSHIHLDHAGAAGTIVRRHPKLTVWVSAIGAPHLVDPSRLERSARQLYGALFDPLWGELAAVPEANVRVADGDVLGWESFPTQGHASHHISYFRDGTLLAGDAAGVRMPGSPVRPARLTAPRHRHRDLARNRAGDSGTEAGTARADPLRLCTRTSTRTSIASTSSSTAGPAVCATAWTQEEFVAAARADAGAEADDYDQVAPFWQSWHGLRRYWDKRS